MGHLTGTTDLASGYTSHPWAEPADLGSAHFNPVLVQLRYRTPHRVWLKAHGAVLQASTRCAGSGSGVVHGSWFVLQTIHGTSCINVAV